MNEVQQPKKKELTNKERAFIEHYLVSWNAADAARKAGYSVKTAREIGHENLTKPHIRSEISARLADLQMNADEVKTRLTTQARGTIEDFGEVDKYGVFRMDLSKAQERGVLSNVKKLKPTRYGYELELHDAQAALVHVGKIHALFVERTEHTGKDGNPITLITLGGDTSTKDL